MLEYTCSIDLWPPRAPECTHIKHTDGMSLMRMLCKGTHWEVEIHLSFASGALYLGLSIASADICSECVTWSSCVQSRYLWRLRCQEDLVMFPLCSCDSHVLSGKSHSVERSG